MKIIVKPLDGIYWDDNSICIGETKESVENTLDNFKRQGNSFYCFNMDLRIDFDNNNCVEFIEFIAGMESNIQPFIYEVFAFEVSADELYEVLKRHNNGAIDDSENGFSYGFINTSVGIYRESTPQSLVEMIEEMQKDGIDTEHNENIEIEKKKASYWATLGIGCKDYYS